jgi:hypothetical protein
VIGEEVKVVLGMNVARNDMDGAGIVDNVVIEVDRSEVAVCILVKLEIDISILDEAFVLVIESVLIEFISSVLVNGKF